MKKKFYLWYKKSGERPKWRLSSVESEGREPDSNLVMLAEEHLLALHCSSGNVVHVLLGHNTRLTLKDQLTLISLWLIKEGGASMGKN